MVNLHGDNQLQKEMLHVRCDVPETTLSKKQIDSETLRVGPEQKTKTHLMKSHTNSSENRALSIPMDQVPS